MKTIKVTEQDIRDALGVSGYSPLANRLIFILFDGKREKSHVEERLEALEKKIQFFVKRKPK
jgi:hypothetical protein